MKTKKCMYCGGRFNIDEDKICCFSCSLVIDVIKATNTAKSHSMNLSKTSNDYWTSKLNEIIIF